MKITELIEQTDPVQGAGYISGRAARRKARGEVQTGPEQMSQGGEDAARLIISFFPGISSVYDARDAIDAARRGEYGDAAMSSAFALLGLVPLVGAGKAGAQQVSSAVKNFISKTPLANKAAATAAKAPDTLPAQTSQAASKAPEAPPTKATQAASKAPEEPSALLGPDGKPMKSQTSQEKPTGLVGADGKPLASTAGPTAGAVKSAASQSDVTKGMAAGADSAGLGKGVAPGVKVADTPAPVKAKPIVPNAVKAGAVGGAALGGAAMLGAMSDNPEQDMGAGKPTPATDKTKSDQTTSKTTTKADQTASKDVTKPEPTTTSKTTAPNIDSMSFNQAFAAARKAADAQGVGPTGQFTWRGKQYQTNRQGEPYVPMNQQTPVQISEMVFYDDLYKIIKMANYK